MQSSAADLARTVNANGGQLSPLTRQAGAGPDVVFAAPPSREHGRLAGANLVDTLGRTMCHA